VPPTDREQIHIKFPVALCLPTSASAAASSLVSSESEEHCKKKKKKKKKKKDFIAWLHAQTSLHYDWTWPCTLYRCEHHFIDAGPPMNVPAQLPGVAEPMVVMATAAAAAAEAPMVASEATAITHENKRGRQEGGDKAVGPPTKRQFSEVLPLVASVPEHQSAVEAAFRDSSYVTTIAVNFPCIDIVSHWAHVHLEYRGADDRRSFFDTPEQYSRFMNSVSISANAKATVLGTAYNIELETEIPGLQGWWAFVQFCPEVSRNRTLFSWAQSIGCTQMRVYGGIDRV
jgi:hypothetical protein